MDMKKVIKIFISGLVILFILILYMDYNDIKYEKKLKNKIINHTEIKNIKYINFYDNYYIVMDNDNLWVFNKKYVELLKIDRILIHDNPRKYDIIYKDGLVIYMKDYYKNNKIYYKYYDLYSYEEKKMVLVGGAYE